MFEFFIALFGGLFYGGKFLNEKSKDKAYELSYKTQTINDNCKKSEWKSKVTDRNLEMELEAFIFDLSNYDEVWKEVSEAYNEMPWETENFICLSPSMVETLYGKGYSKKQKENIAKNNRDKALRIMLARQGKLRCYDADYGVTTGYWENIPLLTQQKWAKEKTEFMLWITEQLRQHGIDEKLYIQDDFGKDAFLASSNPIRNGRYVWEPMISYLCVKHQ